MDLDDEAIRRVIDAGATYLQAQQRGVQLNTIANPAGQVAYTGLRDSLAQVPVATVARQALDACAHDPFNVGTQQQLVRELQQLAQHEPVIRTTLEQLHDQIVQRERSTPPQDSSFTIDLDCPKRSVRPSDVGESGSVYSDSDTDRMIAAGSTRP